MFRLKKRTEMTRGNKPAEKRYAIGADIGGSHLSSTIIDLDTGNIAGDITNTSLDNSASAPEILYTLATNINETMQKAKEARIRGVGLAFPGPFDYIHGISAIHGVGKFQNIFGLDVRTTLRHMLKLPEETDLRFTNDATAFAMGEAIYGAAKGSRMTVILTLGTGVGSAFISDGKIIKEGHGIPENGWVYDMPFEEGTVDEAFSTRWICRRYMELSGTEANGAKEIAERYTDCEKARQVFIEFGQRLGRFILQITAGFHADTVVLGGNISNAWPLFRTEIQKCIADAGSPVKVCQAAMPGCAAISGAAALFRE